MVAIPIAAKSPKKMEVLFDEVLPAVLPTGPALVEYRRFNVRVPTVSESLT